MQTRIARTVNVANSMQSMAPQVSAYVRLSSPNIGKPDRPFSFLRSPSDWTNSALFCMAMETATLPTRIQEQTGRPGSLYDMESVLNRTGSRPIFELQASITPGENTANDSGDLTVNYDYSPPVTNDATVEDSDVTTFGKVEVPRNMPQRHCYANGEQWENEGTVVEV